ncbi:thioether cross-link-forming SCIFF peptide maturase [Abyssisolibacter fermentans]|uniref:thioether cross-link-forming SCIFF peptide maturase n=1 Tax=Abyssisolibacter fermentans TaxID=1766203 RepID=UPI00082B1343|nr:thioether cross-link-forming SCIFF peptide maturase [Abyssisolibacter fermentans]
MLKIHKFEQNGKKIVLDINSGAVHIIDDLIWDILDLFEEYDKKDIIAKLENKYNRQSIEEGIAEVEYLVDKGILYSESNYPEDLDYNKNNLVKALCLHVAHDCNLRCKYCFASQGDYNEEERLLMPLEVGKKALDYLVQNSGSRRNLEVDFFGGEPLMNFDVVKELVYYGRELEKDHDKNFRFTITTNAVLLDKPKMEFINEHMSNVVLSLDGRKEVNDYMRVTINNKGSYDSIISNIAEMVKMRGDKDYFVRGTFTSKNLDFSEDAKHFYDLGFKKTSIEPVVTDLKNDYAIRDEHLETILKEYEKLSKFYLDIKKKADNFSFFHFNIDLNQGPCIYKRLSGCGAGSEYMAVTPEGDLYPCHQFVGDTKFRMGNVYDGIINTDIRDSFKKVNVLSKEDCSQCWARYYCSGGCHANAYYSNGDISKPYKVGCEMERKRIECAISVNANLLQEE